MDEMITILKLLADRTRLTILTLLKDGERCVCDLVDILQTTQPNISQHLRKLKDAGLVQESRRGQWAYYSLSVDNQSYVQAVMSEVTLPDNILENMKKKCTSNDCCN
ncbi:ArsR family transcriptional regulator [Fontibacillus panacisegetis]|uniref:ArsR family transcriptional regulator n=2 Tax=Fontibacillus panacisegetis TaxID=670482 RepID=A0A1G7EHQ0_9BACL|nr:ArsR family transcriptional regulator [Fontibacillus panacisegetis]